MHKFDTATELAMRGKEREAKDQMIFEQMMEAFFKRWSPEDDDDKAMFHAELSSLIRRVYIDAQEPLAKYMTAMMATMPIMPPIVHQK